MNRKSGLYIKWFEEEQEKSTKIKDCLFPSLLLAPPLPRRLPRLLVPIPAGQPPTTRTLLVHRVNFSQCGQAKCDKQNLLYSLTFTEDLIAKLQMD
jgi:hypothetical protein